MLSSPFSHRLLPFLAALLLAISAGPLAAEDKLPFHITGMTLFPDTPQAQAGPPLKGYEFKDSQLQQYLTLNFDEAAAGKKVNVTLIAARTTLGMEKLVKRFNEAVISPDGKLPVSIKLPQAWPVGSYRLQISSEGQRIGNAGYKVVPTEAKRTPITLSKVHIYREKADGGVEEVTKPKVTDHHLYFAGDTKGAQTDGAKVTWILNYFEPEKGTTQKAAGVDILGWPLDNTVVTFDVTLEKDWPEGRYAVELSVDGEPVGQHAFEIVK